jgi:hypothetical protein
MALVQNPIVGEASGKFANAVFFRIFGKNVMRALPLTVHNPQTELQMTQRDKYKACVAYLRPVLAVIQKGWKEEAVGMSAFNAAIGYMVVNAVQQVGGVWQVDPTKLMHAKGTLMTADNLAATNPTGQTIIYTWQDNSGIGDASPDDQFVYVYFNTTINKVAFGFTTQKRSDQTYSFSAPAGWTGNDVAVFGFFLKSDGSIASDDTYCATLTLH